MALNSSKAAAQRKKYRVLLYWALRTGCVCSTTYAVNCVSSADAYVYLLYLSASVLTWLLTSRRCRPLSASAPTRWVAWWRGCSLSVSLSVFRSRSICVPVLSNLLFRQACFPFGNPPTAPACYLPLVIYALMILLRSATTSVLGVCTTVFFCRLLRAAAACTSARWPGLKACVFVVRIQPYSTYVASLA